MNLSQEELAEKIYVTRQTISNWENDKSYPDIQRMYMDILTILQKVWQKQEKLEFQIKI